LDKKLILRLKEFYILETFQVAFYKAQVSSATDEYYGKAFQKMVDMEQGHADYFEVLLNKAGESTPSTVGSMSKLAGGFVGESVEVNGQHDTCTLGVKLENKAINAYKTFIDECKQKEYTVIRDNLMEFLLDEEFHALWLEDYSKSHPN
jgi:demethoxyubiquinone hydroxylase (CLK1/Coq7/Cat5 family)